MTEEQNIEDNLNMVNYIMLHRIYDLLALIAREVAGNDDTEKLINFHELGHLLGPNPSYTSGEENE